MGLNYVSLYFWDFCIAIAVGIGGEFFDAYILNIVLLLEQREEGIH